MRSFLAAVAVFACLGLAGPALAASPTGTWRATISFQNQHIETLFALRFDTEGPTLTGDYSDGLSNRESPITQASFKGGRVGFSVVRDVNGQKFITKYDGTLSGDTITGKCTIDYEGRNHTTDWVARRQK